MAEVHGEIRQEIENIQLPAGYSFFWDSQFKDQGEAIQAIVKFFPLAFLLLIVILVALFGNFREPVIILCILPLSLIGVAIGMLLTGFEFGFFPIAGWLGLLRYDYQKCHCAHRRNQRTTPSRYRPLHFHHRSDGIPNPTGTDGSHNDHFRHGPPIIRYRLPRYGGHHYFRTDFRHLIDLIRHSGSCMSWFYKVKEKRV